MSEAYIGEIRAVGFTFPPPGWLVCDGSLQSIDNYETLFALIGTTYGGDGQNTFGIPDLRGRTPIHQGQGGGLSNYVLGQIGGQENVTLNSQQLPLHAHPLLCSDQAGGSNSAAGAFFSTTDTMLVYSTSGPAVGNMASVVGVAGQSQSHDNLQPYLGILYIIATEGYYPSPN